VSGLTSTNFIVSVCVLVFSQFVWAQTRVQNEVIIMLKNRDSVGVQSKAGGGKSFRGRYKVKNSADHIGIHQIELQQGQTVDQAIADLATDPDVEFVEPNYVLEKMEVDKASVMSLEDLHQLEAATTSGLMLTPANIQTSEAWTAAAPSSAKPIIAIIDSGIDTNHSVLKDAIWNNTDEIAGNGIDDDHNGYVDDKYGWNFANGNNNVWDGDGHGTHVAGIVRGMTQDLFAWPIGSPKIQIMPLKFLDDNGLGSTADAINAIYYAVNNGATILNNSWGGPSYSRALHMAIAYAYEHKVLFVAAAGNAKSNNDDTPMYPASYDVPNVLSVAATNDYDSLASFSNFGSKTVHIASPGVSILSSYPPNSYTYLSGTSMAAPVVAGVAALLAIEKPTMGGYQIKKLVLGSGDVKSSLIGKVTTSARVNVFKSVTSAQTAAVETTQPLYTLTVSGQDRDLASNVAMGGGGCGIVESVGKNIPRGPGLAVLLLVLCLPLVVLLALRPTGRALRKFERYYLHSTVQFDIGDQKVNGLVGTISLGGMGINSPVPLAEGTVVKMQVLGPDGQEKIEVQGRVVWSAGEKKYGISFANMEKEVQGVLKRWMSGLVRSSN
jgi:hypothetical protein